ncbi:MAG: presenilin family intramembrane aspartyl protease [Candidatus Pacearchaeota archaeon]
MKHNLLITLIILGMFLLTQIFGLYLIHEGQIPDFIKNENKEYKNISLFLNILIAFVLAIVLFFFLIQYKWKFFIKLWFGMVIFLALAITFYSLFSIFFKEKDYILFYSFIMSIILTSLKILRNSVVIHNLTEILIYVGVSLIFISFLNPLYVIIFLVMISFYDMWAVWHSGIMQKMAKFQMNEVKIFNGFFIPYLTKELKEKIKKAKENKIKYKKLKVPVAILGGGDVAFTLIPAGVFLVNYGLGSAIFVVLGGFFGLCYLMFFSEKKKFYPAMPFITLGIFISLFLYFFIIKLFL